MIYYPGTDTHAIMPHFTVRDTNPITFLRDIEGRAGYSLKCDPFTEGTLEAREVGAVSWINLENTPIALDPYIGIRQPYEFRFTSGAFTEDDRIEVICYCGVV